MADLPRRTRPTRIKDITGNRYGMLVVLGLASERSKSGRTMWHCECDCGQSKTIMGTNLKRALSQSCGCQVLIAARKPKPQMRTHGFSGTWVYGIWSNMVDRCYNPDNNAFHGYGGRGIRICDRWKNSIADFYEDIGERPTPDHSLDRIDNDGDYCPENCRWATAKEQANNRRSSHLLTYMGETMTIAQWAERLGVNQHLIIDRLKYGWDAELALSTPKGTPWALSRLKNQTK